jgi:hypothetical protein
MANVQINNLDAGTVYIITHRVHAGAPKRGRFLELVEPSAGFQSQRAKFTMLDQPVVPAPTRSFQPENWKFDIPAEQQHGAARRRKTRRSSRKHRSSRKQNRS